MAKTPTKQKITPNSGSPVRSPTKKKISFGGGDRVKTPDKSKTQKVDVYATQADEIAIVVFSRPNDNTPMASFIHPMKVAFNSLEHGDEVAKMWNILMFPPRRGNPDGTTTMKTPPAYKWDWNCGVVVMTEDKTLPQMGRDIAKSFTRFTSKPMSGMKQPDEYEFRTAFQLDVKPVNHYLLDIDTAKALRSLYKSYDKSELMMDADLMEAYFGDADTGAAFLEEMDDDDWETLLG